MAGNGIVKHQTMTSLVEDYLTVRRRMDFSLDIAGYQLMRFARYAEASGHQGPITLKLAQQWAQYNTTCPTTVSDRIRVIRPFIKYRAQFDPGTEVPSINFMCRKRQRLTPHIYTQGEIQSILDAASELTPKEGVRPAAYETLYGLLAATGLRLSEAMKLKISDVDLDRNLITVRESKCRKSRIIPLHSTTAAALNRYTKIREEDFIARTSKPFFLLEGGHRLEKDTAQRQFRRICNRLKIKARGAHPTPRIQDLRHSFITHCILRWYQQGISVDKEILSLSTYVGHAEVTYTYWYITGVPELMAIASKRFESIFREGLT